MNSGWQKPLQLIKDLIDVYGFLQNGWVLDAFCGSGATSHAALLMGMNSFAFDKSKYKVDATLYRTSHFRELHGAKAELEASGKKRARDKDSDEDSADEEADGAVVEHFEVAGTQDQADQFGGSTSQYPSVPVGTPPPTAADHRLDAAGVTDNEEDADDEPDELDKLLLAAEEKNKAGS